MSKVFNPSTAIYTPSEVAVYGVEQIRQIQNSAARGIKLGIPEIDEYFAPLLPGQVCAIIAQTSNYKSGLMHFIEHQAAHEISQNPNRKDEIIVHVSVEEGVEEQAYLEFARYTGEDAGKLARGNVQDWSRLERAAVTVGTVPIFRIGDSLARAEDAPNLTMSNMIRAVKHLREDVLDWKPKIAGLFFDYLQAFPYDEEHQKLNRDDQRRLQVRADIYRLRLAASYFACPVFVGVQAKQNLQGANPPIMLPGVYDGEESASIAQRCDRVLTLWMPARTAVVGETIQKGNFNFTVDIDDLFIKVAKQRGGLPAGKAWRCKIDFATNMLRTH